MKKELYVEILKSTLLPFVRSVYPDGHKVMQDKDPKHVSETGWRKTILHGEKLPQSPLIYTPSGIFGTNLKNLSAVKPSQRQNKNL